MPLRSLLISLALLASAARADIVYLRDGSRYTGDLISRTEHEVIFRVTTADGKASALRNFRAAEVVRIERTRKRPPDAAATPAPQTDRAAWSDSQVEQMLRECFELVDGPDIQSARRAIQRTLDAARPDQLPQLERLARSVRNVELADFAADIRIQDALRDSGGERVFDLKTPTRYERAALGRRLAQMQDKLLDEKHGGRTLVEWAQHPRDYDRLRAGATEMVRQALLVNALLAARLQYDPQLAADRDSKAALARLRGDLTLFVAQVRSLPGFTSLGAGRRPSGDALKRRSAEPSELELERRMQRAAREAARRRAQERAPQPASQPAPLERPEGDVPVNDGGELDSPEPFRRDRPADEPEPEDGTALP